MSLVISLFCCFVFVNGIFSEKKYDEEAGRAYLRKINADIQVKTTESVLASWAYESNITDENLRHQLEVSAQLANYTKEIWKETIKFPWKTFEDPDVRRQFQKFSVLGTAILSPEKYKRFNKIISDMQSTYGKAKICHYHNRSDCSLQLEPELTEILIKSRDPDELRYYWEEWRNAAGKPVRKLFKEYVDLSNEAAVLNNFTDNSEFWLKDYESKDFKEQIEELWEQLRPLYLQLHAFVRRRLREQYGEQHVTKRGPIPAHLLGNMWGQSWGNIFDFIAPYPGKPSMDVTPNMVKQGYTPLRMFKLAEEFFTSLNLSPMPDTFWKNSILEKPKDGRDLICHASAWDFYDGKDFRIKQCTRVTMEDLNTVHHEMGHIQYFLQYKNQPLVYKEGTNPGFHEAVGDVMALSVSTPKHLNKIGLLNVTEDDAESEINQLFSMALDKIAFLPFGYLMDQWRWSVFQGKTTEKDYNCKWWQLREKYQGLSPSVIRTEDDFDPGAKYHTVGNVPYIRYFVSFVIQFQFHRSLCIAANEFDPADPASKPLHKCDIFQSKQAGALLKEMLQMGSSKPWPDAMEALTGQREMDASALLEYFSVLQDWLEKENARTGEFIGWEPSRQGCIYEVEDTEGAKASNIQGNFEDDNIAFSYAEFVRQDDNSFGLPDYLEEVRPSYHALRNRQKENYFQTKYFLPKRKIRRFSKQNTALYLRGGSNIDNLAKEQQIKKIKKRKDAREQSQRFFDCGTYQICKGPAEKKSNSKEAELTNVILKNIYLIKNSENGNRGLFSPGEHSWLSRREAEKDKKNVEKLTENNNNNSNSNNSNISEEKKIMDKQESKEKANDSEKESESDSENLQDELDRVQQEGADELLWKAELVKNEAEKMLQSYTTWSVHSSNMTNYYNHWAHNCNGYLNKNPDSEAKPCEKVQYDSESRKRSRNILPFYHTPNHFRRGKTSEINLNSLESFSKTAGSNSLKNAAEGKKRLHFKEYDLLGVISVDNLLAKGVSDREHDDKRRQIDLSNKRKLNYVLLVGKLSENSKPETQRKRQKKAYKKYHYKPRNPVVYNSVIINSGGKSEKPDDCPTLTSMLNNRMPWIFDDGRNVREANPRKNVRELSQGNRFSQNGYINSVKTNKYNKNNIVQYFGCLQLCNFILEYRR